MGLLSQEASGSLTATNSSSLTKLNVITCLHAVNPRGHKQKAEPLSASTGQMLGLSYVRVVF